MLVMGMPARFAFFVCPLALQCTRGCRPPAPNTGACWCGGNHVDGVKPPAVGIEEGHDVEGRHFSVEGVGVLEVVVPDFVNGVAEKFGGPVLAAS
jgi:hypothetical protein